MAKYTFLDLAADVLKQSSTAIDVSTIWSRAVESGLASRLDSQGKTPWTTLGSRLYVDSKDNSQSIFFRVGKNPVCFGLNGVHSDQIPADLLSKGAQAPAPKLKERNLHPLLAFFAHLYLDSAYVKTIYHEKSSKKNYAEWIHPDLAGVCFPDLEVEPLALASSLGELPLRLLSFELKLSLDFSNLRASFFQAVSNSSWAHQGYLAAADIDGSPEFLAELKRLSSTFGIGVISLNVDSPDDSEVLYPAKEREALDWVAINKLSAANPDFRQFLKDVQIDIQGKKVHPAEYDRIETDTDKLRLLIDPSLKK